MINDEELKISHAHIRTFTGQMVDLSKGPTPEQVSIRDIAHSLAYQCRFVGHTSRFYSVAEHSIYVAMHAAPLWRVYYLLHDAHEYIYQDLSKPLKGYLGSFTSVYEGLVDKCDRAILKAYDLSYDKMQNLKKDIKQVDTRLLRLEVDIFLGNKVVDLNVDDPLADVVWGLPPNEAERLFIEMFQTLML